MKYLTGEKASSASDQYNNPTTFHLFLHEIAPFAWAVEHPPPSACQRADSIDRRPGWQPSRCAHISRATGHREIDSMTAELGIAATKALDTARRTPFWLLAALTVVAFAVWMRPDLQASLPPEAISWLPLALVCHSACNIDPLSRGVGVQN
jgi:hypothetical protein